MDKFFKVFDSLKDGINTPMEIASIVFTFLLSLLPLIIKMIKVTSLDDFDRLFVPKNERSIQQVVIKIKDYLIILFFYLLVGGYFSFILTINLFSIFLNNTFALVMLFIFLISLAVIGIKIFINGIFVKKESLNNLKGSKFLENFLSIVFIINFVTGFYIYALLLYPFIKEIQSLRFNYLEVGILLISPLLLLVMYKAYHTRFNHEYICEKISEEQFNRTRLALSYSIDNDKMVFTKPSDSSKKEIYLFDKSSNLFFKFTKEQSIEAK